MSQEDINDTFHFYDTIGDGKIAASQLPNALRALMLNPTEESINKMTKQWEKKPDTRISIQEFMPIFQAMSKECGRSTSLQEFQTLLSHFDREGNGFITLAELRGMLSNTGEKLTSREVDSLLFGVEEIDGKIKIDDFLQKHMQIK
ncbi:unnamed protein product [Caenorhabditis angaria]|uniref:EF-hand domain-containing protein n=1 Tax=Caenorhabditis angaria TaxID=860376 RepID=A0A9P1MYL3_9PELO|nr:unnamed protein product [Caenorhabditis angaria]